MATKYIDFIRNCKDEFFEIFFTYGRVKFARQFPQKGGRNKLLWSPLSVYNIPLAVLSLFRPSDYLPLRTTDMKNILDKY